MSDIDEKLREMLNDSVIILEANRDVGPRKWEVALNLFLDDVIPQLKQAFTDAGYIQMAYNPAKQEVAGKPVADVLQTDNTLMSGQEWYERFMKELQSKPDYIMSIFQEHDTDLIARGKVRHAARRAAGISE